MVEFALILPLLLLVLGGIIDFGRAYYEQIVLTNAAREGARMAALGYTPGQVEARADVAARGLNGELVNPVTATITSAACVSGGGATQAAIVRVVPNTAFTWVILDVLPGVPTPILDAEGSMRCFG